MIGHLQRNKVADLLPHVGWIHSLDSERLLAEVGKQATHQQRSIEGFLQINISNEEQKHGFSPETFAEMSPDQTPPGVRILGLMGMAAYTEDAEEIRPTFRALRQLFEKHAPRWRAAGHPFDQLSMGMSGDFAVAIEEGATTVRIGSLLLEGLKEG
ncbi:MAG: YggS family pyridoxal phosphate-dependent enzyme [Zavarzinella sp.]